MEQGMQDGAPFRNPFRSFPIPEQMRLSSPWIALQFVHGDELAQFIKWSDYAVRLWCRNILTGGGRRRDEEDEPLCIYVNV